MGGTTTGKTKINDGLALLRRSSGVRVEFQNLNEKDTELLITERDCPESERVAWIRSLKTETGTKRDRPVASSTCHGEEKKKCEQTKAVFYHVGFRTALLFAGFSAGVGRLIFSVARVS